MSEEDKTFEIITRKRFAELLRSGVRAIFNKDNFVCITCDKRVKECKCSEKKE